MSATYAHQGLPQGIKPFDLPDVLERLRGHFRLRDEDITYVRYALRQMRSEDFSAGRICAIWLSAATLVRKLGFHPRRVNRIEARLHKCGFILRTSTRNGRRYGCREEDGKISLACGINFGPLVDRAGELLLLVRSEILKADELARDRLRAKNLIYRIHGLGVQEALAAAREVFPRMRPSEIQDTGRLAKIIAALEAVLEDFSTQAGQTIQPAQSDSLVRPNTKTKNKTKTCSEDKQCPPRPLRVTPGLCCLLASSSLNTAIQLYSKAMDDGAEPSWRSVISAARDDARASGISGMDWEEACLRLGGERAALCFLIVARNAQREGRFRVRNIPAAFAGMVRADARQTQVLNSLLSELTQFASEGGGAAHVQIQARASRETRKSIYGGR